MPVHITLDQDRSGEAYDAKLAEVLSFTDYDRGVEIVSKQNGTESGNPIVMVRFVVAAPYSSGMPFLACWVFTLKEFLAVAQALQGCHGAPEGVIGVIGTHSGDVHAGHSKTCGLRGGGLCNCECPAPVTPPPGAILAVPAAQAAQVLKQVFDYGEKLPDGQFRKHPTAVPADRAFVRPVRTSYRHEKCGGITSMPIAIAETYAATPGFYGRTFCATCHDYFPVGAAGEFVWNDGIGEKVGT